MKVFTRQLGLFGSVVFLAAIASAQTSVPMTTSSLIACSKAGVSECEFELAKITETGAGTAKNLAVAKALYEKAYRGGVEEAGPALLRLARLEQAESSATNVTPAIVPDVPSVSKTHSGHLSSHALGIYYGDDGLPLGFEHTSFDQSDVDFGRQFKGSGCIHYGGGFERCDAVFKSDGQVVRIATWYRNGHLASMAQLVRSGCAARSEEFEKRMQSESRDNTLLMTAAFVPSGIYNFSQSAEILAWSANDTLHALTVCEPNDYGMIVISRQSLAAEQVAARTRGAAKVR